MIDPSPDLIDELYAASAGDLRLITVAADRPGVVPAIQRARRLGIAVSLGHQVAEPPDIRAAVSAGAGFVTHFGNGLPELIHRHSNPLWTSLDSDALSTMIVSDGFHLPDELLRIVWRIKHAERCIITSDSAPVAGLEDGTYSAFGQTVTLKNGRITVADSEYLAGSAARMIDCVNHFAAVCDASEAELWRVSYSNPLVLSGAAAETCASEPLVQYVADRGSFEPLSK